MYPASLWSTISNVATTSDKVILVPLTNSLYVPGKLSDVEHVLVDVGTGYFVKKVHLSIQTVLTQLIPAAQTRPQAVKYYNEKVDYLKTNLDTLEETIGKKRENLNYLVTALQGKVQAQAQAQAQTTKS